MGTMNSFFAKTHKTLIAMWLMLNFNKQKMLSSLFVFQMKDSLPNRFLRDCRCRPLIDFSGDVPKFSIFFSTDSFMQIFDGKLTMKMKCPEKTLITGGQVTVFEFAFN